MATYFITNLGKKVGNAAGEVATVPGKAIQGIVHPGQSTKTIKSTAILGAARVADLGRYDINVFVSVIIIVGPAIYAFYKAMNYSIGDTANVSDEDVRMAKDFLEHARRTGAAVVLPKEVIVFKSDGYGDEDTEKVVAASEIRDGWAGSEEMAPSTIDVIVEAAEDSMEIQWNSYYIKGLFKKLGEFEEKGTIMTILSPTTSEGGGYHIPDDGAAAMFELGRI